MTNPLTISNPLGKRLLKYPLRALLMASMGLGLAGCANPPAGDGGSPKAGLPEVPALSFAAKWNADLKLANGDQAQQIFLRDEFVIIYTRLHWAYVLDKDQGVIRFAAHVTDERNVLHPPVVLKDWVVFPTINTLEVYAREGKKLRSVDTGGVSLRSNAVGLGTRIFFGGDGLAGGRLVSEDLSGNQYKDATVRWELLTRGGVSSAPAYHMGLVYVGDERGGVYAVNADSRAPVWAVKEEQMEENVFKTRGPIKADLKIDDYGLYVPSTDTKLYCVERTTGKIRWQFFAGVPLYTSPTLTATSVYLFVPDQGLVFLDKLNGEYNRRPKWISADAIKFLAEDEKHVYAERKDHAIIAIDKANGETLFSSKRSDFVAYTANTNKDPKFGYWVYGTTKDGQVRAIMPVYRPGTHGEIVLDFEPVNAIAMK